MGRTGRPLKKVGGPIGEAGTYVCYYTSCICICLYMRVYPGLVNPGTIAIGYPGLVNKHDTGNSESNASWQHIYSLGTMSIAVATEGWLPGQAPKFAQMKLVNHNINSLKAFP